MISDLNRSIRTLDDGLVSSSSDDEIERVVEKKVEVLYGLKESKEFIDRHLKSVMESQLNIIRAKEDIIED